jgi:hypothetical protein
MIVDNRDCPQVFGDPYQELVASKIAAEKEEVAYDLKLLVCEA